MNEPIVRMVNVTKEFSLRNERISVLRNINWNIPAGASIAIMGSSGSGKTTLLNLIGRFEIPTAGKVIWSGVGDLGVLPRAKAGDFYRSEVGFVFQRFNLLSDLTAVENIRLPFLVSGEAPGVARAKALDLIKSLGLEELEDHRPREMSVGQQQRVAIGRTIAKRPRLLLADEPTGSVDETNKDNILRLLLDYQRNSKTTLVVATHDQSVAKACDFTVSVVQGEVKA
jgi:ABC-type lipoprotein export system ATPase subunit